MFSRPCSSSTVAVMRYVPPSAVSKVQRTGSSTERTVQTCSSTSSCSQEPLAKVQCRRTARISIARPAIRLPSRSVTIASTLMGWPCSTKVRSLRRPTYSSAGCTSNCAAAVQAWRFTSMTVASALMLVG